MMANQPAAPCPPRSRLGFTPDVGGARSVIRTVEPTGEVIEMANKPHGERRRERNSFTRALKRMCARLDDSGPQGVEWTDDYFRNRRTARVRVVALWVAGSYARGALDCGDLDVIIEIVLEQGGMPPKSTVARAIFGTSRDPVRLRSLSAQCPPPNSGQSLEF
jgi:hypothetical protein